MTTLRKWQRHEVTCVNPDGFTANDIYHMYVIMGFSMILVSEITNIPRAPLSHYIVNNQLNEEHSFDKEITRLSRRDKQAAMMKDWDYFERPKTGRPGTDGPEEDILSGFGL